MECFLDGAGAGVTSEDYTFVGEPKALFSTYGTFDGESVEIQKLREDGTYSVITDGSFTAATDKIITLPKGSRVRFVTSSGGGTPSITVCVGKISGCR